MICLSIPMMGAKSIEFRGFVYNTSLKFINNSRVEIVYLSGRNYKDEKYYAATYTNKRGEWRLKVPLKNKIIIKTFSNGFITEKRIINLETEKSLKNNKVTVRSQMKRGMKQIEWGSFEHHMLYVKSSDQKAIEGLTGSKEKSKVEDYITKKMKKSQWADAYIFAGYSSFRKGNLMESKEYFNKAGSKTLVQSDGEQIF